MKYFILGIAFCNFIICIYGQECIWKRYNRDKTLPYVHLGRYIPASERTAYWPSKPSSCSTCIGYKRKSRKASPIAFLNYVRGGTSNCVYLTNGYNVDAEPASAYYYAELPVYEAAIDLSNKTVEVGGTVVVETEYYELVNGNDTNEFMFLNEDFKKTENATLIDIDEDYEATEVQIDYETKRNTSVVDRQDRSYITYQYKKMTYKIMDDGKEENSTLYAAVIHSNDNFFTIDFETIKLTHAQDRNCQLYLSPRSYSVKQADLYYINIQLLTTDNCNRDVSNAHIFVSFEDILDFSEMKIIRNGLCRGSPDVLIHNKKSLYVKYNWFRMGTKSCMTVVLKVAENIDRGFSSRYVHALLLVRYTGYVNDQNVTNSFQFPFKVFVPTNTFKKMFYLRSEEFYVKRVAGGQLKIGESPTFFRINPYDVVDEESISVQLQNSSYYNKFEYTKNHTKKKLIHRADDLIIQDDDLHLDTDLNYGDSVKFSSTSKTSSFKRFYSYDLKWVSNTEDEISSPSFEYKITMIYVNRITDEVFYICMDLLPKSCMVYDLDVKKHKALNTQIQQLHAFYNNAIYGTSSNQSYLQHVLEASNEKEILKSSYEMVESFIDSILSVEYTRYSEYNDMDQIYIFTQHHNYSVRYYGLYNESEGSYIFTWPSSNGCALTVAKENATSFASCKTIKEYCADAKNGYYWIHGDNEKSEAFEVYCEMEFDEGGWLMLVNHTSYGSGNDTPIAEQTTDDLEEFFTSNNSKYLKSPNGLKNLYNKMKFIQLRLYCYRDTPGRTIHIKTLDKTGNSALTWLLKEHSQLTPFCKSYFRYDDDTSELTFECDEDHTGTWGKSPNTKENVLYTDLLFKEDLYYYSIGVTDEDDKTWSQCDSNDNNYSYGNWKIFAR